MSVYLDASILVALFYERSVHRTCRQFFARESVSPDRQRFSAAEFPSVIARHVRTKDITKDDARLVFSNFDTWTTRTTQRTPIGTSDIVAPDVLLCRLDLALRTPDALNIAIAQRLGATLATFDKKMAKRLAPSELELREHRNRPEPRIPKG